MKLLIDYGLCTKCLRCIKDCPAGVLTLDRNRFPKVDENGGAQRCMKCQHCMAICPTAALSIYGKKPENSLVPDALPSARSIEQLIRFRRSCRHYLSQDLDRDKLAKLKEIVAYSPTGVNDHRLHFAFVDRLEVMNEIRDYVNSQLFDAAAASGEMPERFAMLERYRGHLARKKDVIFRGAPHLVVVSAPKNSPCPEFDPIIALSYFEFMAQSLGVGTCWCGIFYYVINFIFPELRERFGIPNDYRVGYTMLFGEPEWQYQRSVQRDPANIFEVK